MFKALGRKICKHLLGHHINQVLGEINTNLFLREDFVVTPEGVLISGVFATTSVATTRCKWCGTEEQINGFRNSFEVRGINIGPPIPRLTLDEQLALFSARHRLGMSDPTMPGLSKRDLTLAELDSWVATILVGGPVLHHRRTATIVEADYVHRD